MDTTKVNENLIKKAVSKSTNVEEFRKMIEVEVLKIIKDLAEKGEAPQEKIQAIARLTLDLIQPGMTLENLYHNAVKLDDQYSELAPVVIKIMREYEEKYGKKTLTAVSELIKQGDYDQAENMVKKLLQFKIAN